MVSLAIFWSVKNVEARPLELAGGRGALFPKSCRLMHLLWYSANFLKSSSGIREYASARGMTLPSALISREGKLARTNAML
jgi:hypothetical protein